MTDFERNKARVTAEYEALINRKNIVSDSYNGIYDRYVYPVLTAAHAPIIWKYDMNPETNPYFMERLGINAVLNSGAIYLNGKSITLLQELRAMTESHFCSSRERQPC